MEDGKLHTPLADCFLNGITRQTIIEMAAEKGVEVVERHIEPEELTKVKECFLTGTAAEVTPVSQIGEYHFKPDALTRKFVQGYADLVNGC
jgi:branched-chain amino acid aminotransferase